MRKSVTTIAIVLVVIGSAVYYGLQARRVTFTPHTIHYSVISFDTDGNRLETSLVRTVDSSGNWHHSQTMPDGSVKEGHGRMTRLPNIDQASRRDEIAGRSVLVQTTRNHDSTLEQAYSVELQDDLRHVLRDANGKLILKMEAVEVRLN